MSNDSFDFDEKMAISREFHRSAQVLPVGPLACENSSVEWPNLLNEFGLLRKKRKNGPHLGVLVQLVSPPLFVGREVALY